LSATVHRWVGEPPSRAHLEELMVSEGLQPHGWSNGPGDTYARHDHTYHKVLYCVSGSIEFQTVEDAIELLPGDRLEIEKGTPHSATVGPRGVECIEAAIKQS